ncbi:hypothetical protein M2360_004623 [Rhizobium sp. SG_E_25_P2]|uniref:hypothetical protein n=1 Tax=Rhizobium sp. SG_E_25_P2 TaxID=2879942 RepID=UPI002473A7B1|nr:hypothetical protein [Rhizobium sp. SG_E_25_P2]MDH6269196.1 hypothetical protein [Rhizobium sp. SG_E_25_P2]
MRTEIEQKQFELVLDISERRGVEGVKILHFVIEECLRFYQKKYGIDFYEEILQLLELKGAMESRIRHLPRPVKSLYYQLHANKFQITETCDFDEEMQESITFQIDEIFLCDGVSASDVLHIFETGLKRSNTEKLPEFYKLNEHAINEKIDAANDTTKL